MVQFYIGNGKGKTTAAFGLALRALGWGKSVYIAQFLKSKDSCCGEIKAVNKYKLKVKVERFKNQTHPIFLKKEKVDLNKLKESIENSLSKIEKYIDNKRFDLIILDEFLNVCGSGFVSLERVKDIIKKSKEIELVLTGRTAPQGLIELADYVSFIEKVKHPFDKKILARKGIEY